MLLPSIAQVLGLCAFGVVAWSFTELGSLPPEYRTRLVVYGSFTIALGGSVGSLPVTLEAFRKRLSSWQDWGALIFSGIASFVEIIIALSFLGGFDIQQNVARVVVLALLGTLDTCFGMAELGEYLATYDERLEQWRNDYKEAVREYYQMPTNVQESIQYETPTGDYAETPVMVSEIVNSNGTEPVVCYCGVVLDSKKAKGPHFKKHYKEWREFLTPELAYQAMFRKYAETMHLGDIEFPNLDKFKEVMKKQ